jgi:uncharacterized protein (TIGR02597 family)
VGLFTIASVQAQSNVVSDPVGFYKVPINPGANFISAPLHKVHAYRGTVSGVSGNVVTLNGNPNFTVNQFGPADGFSQYVLIVRNDNSANPGIQGDWWNVTANAAGTVTLDPAQGSVATIGASDQIEIRKKTSLQDLFGHLSTLILNKDSDGAGNASQEDVIRSVSGTSFGLEIFYHDGTLTAGQQGYIVDGNGPFDGSTITVDPDEPLMVFRKTGSTSTNVVSLGQVHSKKLTHYFGAGANTFANAFPANAPLGSTGLNAVAAQDSDGAANQNQEDVIRSVVGTSFAQEIFLHDGSLTATPPIWIVDGNPDDTAPLTAGNGYIYFVKTATGGRTWRQNVPFTP